MRMGILMKMVALLPVLTSCSEVAQKSEYPLLESNAIQSANFEIVSLLSPEYAAVSDIIYVEDRQSYFVSFWSDEVWQINNDGQTMDVLRGKGRLPESGIYFDPDHYVDWLYTGDAREKKYAKTLDGAMLSPQDLRGLFESAEHKVLVHSANPDRYRYYLNQGDAWWQIVMSAPAERADGIIDNHPLSRDESEPTGFSRISPVRYFGSNTPRSVKLLRFQKTGAIKQGIFSFADIGWQGNLGIADFELQHQGEVLKFAASHRRGFGGGDDGGIEFYLYPDVKHPAALTAFLVYRGARFDHMPKEVGLYIIRPKKSVDTPFNEG